MSNGTTKASAVLYAGTGGFQIVSVGERKVRTPAAGEVRIRVTAASVNPTDILLRDPGLGSLPLPMTPGMDAAGVIESVGEGVSRLAVGDAVMAAVSPTRAEGGAQAELIVVPAASVVPRPRNASLIEAATVPMNGLTALYALELAGLSPGQLLAVTGGAGWLAYLAIVLAKQRGLRVVADAGAQELAAVRGYGAEIAVERSDDFAGAVRKAVPMGVDALLDTALLDEAPFPALRDGGVYIPVRGWKGRQDEPRIQIRPVSVPEVLERTEWLTLLRDLVEAGTVIPKVAATYPVARVADAQRAQLAGGVRGRLVLTF